MPSPKRKQVKPIDEWGVDEWEAAYNQLNAKYEGLLKEWRGILIFLHKAIGRIQENIN